MRTLTILISISSALLLLACSPSTKTEDDVAAIRAHLDAEASAKAEDAREMKEIKARRAAQRAARSASAASAASAGG